MNTIAQICSVDGCVRIARSRGWCSLHYKRWKRNGDPQKLVVGTIGTCIVDNCDNRHAAKGYCRPHYKRLNRFGDPLKKTSAEYHGMTETAEYRSWCHMKGRCYDKNDRYYRDYGDRNIVVCERWLHSFRSFHEDIGSRPTSQHSLDRKDTDGNYSCGRCQQCAINGWPPNCRWATKREQAVSRRIRRNNTSGYQGVSWHKTANQWSANIGTGGRRLHLGYFKSPIDAALAYNEAVLRYHPAGATLNVIPKGGVADGQRSI